jgi:lipoic acid synthetase
MLLGHTCTRGCRFCAVTTGNPRGAVDPREPEHVARAIASLGLSYVVLTMVDRDDLLDGGAAHVASTVSSLHERQPGLLVEALVGDFGGRLRDVDVVLDAEPDVFAHNVEVPRRLTPAIRDAKCSYDRSIDVLRHAKARAPGRLTKSSIMVGVGEVNDEVVETMSDLRNAGVDVVTVGQYLRPTPRHAPVDRYVDPEQFAEFERAGLSLGLAFVASGPLVRSSYHAAEAFMATRLRAAPGDARPPERASAHVAHSDRESPARLISPSQLISASALVRAR